MEGQEDTVLENKRPTFIVFIQTTFRGPLQKPVFDLCCFLQVFRMIWFLNTYLSSIFYCYRSALSHKSATSTMTSQITVIWKVLLWLHKKGFKHWGENRSGNSRGYTLRKGFKETAMLLGYVQSSQARAEESRFLMTFKQPKQCHHCRKDLLQQKLATINPVKSVGLWES